MFNSPTFSLITACIEADFPKSLASVGRCPTWLYVLGPGWGGVLVGVSTWCPPLFLKRLTYFYFYFYLLRPYTGQTRSVGLVTAVTEAHMSRSSGLQNDGTDKHTQALSGRRRTHPVTSTLWLRSKLKGMMSPQSPHPSTSSQQILALTSAMWSRVSAHIPPVANHFSFDPFSTRARTSSCGRYIGMGRSSAA